MKVYVTTADNQYGFWKEPFFGELAGFCRGGDDRPYAIVIHSDTGEFHMVSLHLIRKDN